jgi:hypothetical protein
MKGLTAAWAFGAFLATLGLLVARRAAPGRHGLELDAYVLVLGGLALMALMAWLRKAAPASPHSELDEALDRKRDDPTRIAELDRLEREVYMGAARAFDFHYRFRPVVREIAAARLERRGLRLDTGTDAVQSLLGDELWELVRPERDPPSNRQAAGPGVEEIRNTVERLERI